MPSSRAVLAMAVLTAAVAVVLGGCAQVGPVRPPSAGIPAVVGDFSAQRQGAEVQFTWTVPARTSDGEALKAANLPLRYQLCVWLGEANKSAACPRALPLPGHAVNLAQLRPGGSGFVTLALGAENAGGGSAGWSNRVTVPLTPVAAPPALETATPSAAGVTLRWRWPRQPAAAPAPAVAVIRDGAVVAQVPAGPAAAAGVYLDASAAANQHYVYELRSLAGIGPTRVASGDSRSLQVDTVDIFPPPAPTGVQAVLTPAGVELSWNPAPARDLAGYNIYLQMGDGPWQKRNPELVPTPAYLDPHAPSPQPQAGTRYAVTAVDQAGNESPRSAPAAVR